MSLAEAEAALAAGELQLAADTGPADKGLEEAARALAPEPAPDGEPEPDEAEAEPPAAARPEPEPDPEPAPDYSSKVTVMRGDDPRAKAAEPPKAEDVEIEPSSIVSGAGTLEMLATINANLKQTEGPTFQVAALQSGYSVQAQPLTFRQISALQASSVDPFAARTRLLRTVHACLGEFSCGKFPYPEWLARTAQGDYDSLMYGLYAATYPGSNEFDITCRHCNHLNKVSCDVADLAQIAGAGVRHMISRLIDPSVDKKSLLGESLVGRTVKKRLPKTGIVAEITNPSMQDYMDSVAYFQSITDKATGQLAPGREGEDQIRTLVMYTTRLLVPSRADRGKYVSIQKPDDRASLIGKLPRVDGAALTAAINAEVEHLSVNYKIPNFKCAACSKPNTELVLNFENLLFIKLQASL
jgi:hypothetical protein